METQELLTTDFQISQRRGIFIDISKVFHEVPKQLSEDQKEIWDCINLVYRTLCSVLYNFVPTSGHPGGSISSGQIVQALLFQHQLAVPYQIFLFHVSFSQNIRE